MLFEKEIYVRKKKYVRLLIKFFYGTWLYKRMIAKLILDLELGTLELKILKLVTIHSPGYGNDVFIKALHIH